jgi:hypothetical protein
LEQFMRLQLALFAGLLALPSAAPAFCGFFVSGADAKLYNDASQVVLMRKGNRTVMSMSNNYKGPTGDFAMVVPVPVVLQKEQVKTLPTNVFEKVDQLSAPRLVEYWETDPCYEEIDLDEEGAVDDLFGAMEDDGGPPGGSGVKIEAQFTVGEYEIVILSAKEANGLDAWLRGNKYNIPQGAAEALAPYVREEMKFFVAKVNIKKVKRDADGVVVLSPLRFDFESPTLRLPVRLGLLNAQGKQDLLIYLLHDKSRFEVANYPNVFIPSNLEVENEVRERFGEFYTALFDATLEKAGGKAVITEYAWQTTSCDPCPVPPLQPADLYTLGGDVLVGGRAPGASKGPAIRPSQPFFGSFSSWVLTRMHTRYSKDTLSEDLVFVEAGPVRGGRGSAGASLEQPGGVEKASANNFQGRYIIRHYWEGPVKCANPVYGRWGGPPSGGSKTQAATKLAAAKRGGVKLNESVRSNLPQLAIPGKAAPSR